MHVAVYFLACFGLTFLIQNKVDFIYGKLDLIDRLLECSFCLGVWTGLSLWGLAWVFYGEPLVVLTKPHCFWLQALGGGAIWALASGGFCYTLSMITELAEKTVEDLR